MVEEVDGGGEGGSEFVEERWTGIMGEEQFDEPLELRRDEHDIDRRCEEDGIRGVDGGDDFFELLLLCFECSDALADVLDNERVLRVCQFEEPDVLHRHALHSLGAAVQDTDLHGGISCFPVWGARGLKVMGVGEFTN